MVINHQRECGGLGDDAGVDALAVQCEDFTELGSVLSALLL